MSRSLRIPGLIDLVRADTRSDIRGLADDTRLDRRFEARGPLINRILVERIRNVLRIDGVPLPSVAPRQDAERMRTQDALRRRLDPAGATPLWDDETIAGLAGVVRGRGGSALGPATQQAVGRLFVADYRGTSESWDAAKVLDDAVHTRNPVRAIFLQLSGRLQRSRRLLADLVKDDLAGVHATGIAVHNLVRGFERMRELWSDPRWRSAAGRRRGGTVPVRAAERVAPGDHAGRHRRRRGASGHARRARTRSRARAHPRPRRRVHDGDLGAVSGGRVRSGPAARGVGAGRRGAGDREGITSGPIMTEDVIFTPLKFRNLTVKNRIFRSNISGRFDNEDGSLTQTRINWECKFAAGGVGAIISSYVPVLMEGRIIAGYATVHRDDFIPLWERLGEAVHRFDCKYIMQLSHSGRQMDLPGVHNSHRPALSSTSRKESLHGFLCRAAGKPEIDQLVHAFAAGAWRAREAGLDGVELHAANGYLFTQFLSSGINDRTDEYGGPLQNRARFLLEVIRAIRARVGRDFHLQVKLSAVDRNNVIPWEKKGNVLADTIEVAKWCESEGADAIHVSTGSLFPHPLNPPGDFSFETIATTYDAMISSGVDASAISCCFATASCGRSSAGSGSV